MPTCEDLQQLAETIGAELRPEGWVLPYYHRPGAFQLLPVNDWLRARQVAAIAIDRMLQDRLPCGCYGTCQGHPGAEPDDEGDYGVPVHEQEALTSRDEKLREAALKPSPITRMFTDEEKSDGKIHTIADIEEVIDNWQHRSDMMKCKTCMWYVPKKREGTGREIGRCRQSSPTIKGWPAIYPDDWCGAHKLDESKV